MRDGNSDAPESAVRQVAKLKAGDSYCRARFIPAIHVSPDAIRGSKRELSQLLSPVIARAAKLSFGDYRLLTIHSFTKDYDVVVAAIIVRQGDTIEIQDYF
jgi:hypothetical protein